MTDEKKIGSAKRFLTPKDLLRVFGILLVLIAFDQEFTSLESRTKGSSPTLYLLFGGLILSFTLRHKKREKVPPNKTKKIWMYFLRILGVLLLLEVIVAGIINPHMRPPFQVIGINIWIWYNPVKRYLADRLPIRAKKIGMVLLRIYGAVLVVQGFFILAGKGPSFSTGEVSFWGTASILLGAWILYNPVKRYFIKNIKNPQEFTS